MLNNKLLHDFVQNWTGKGYEKGESQPFWIELLLALGIENPSQFIEFEQQVHIDHTAFIDGFIRSTKVLIEQKSVQKDLGTPIKQSDGTSLNPFQQAKRYAAELPYSERPRWIVTCNFREFWVYDMEQPHAEPQKILLQDIEKEHYRLKFLIDQGNEQLKREMELSIKAGDLVGEIYDAILPQYSNPESPETLQSLNQLCVRLVFCLFAEDAGLFGDRNEFHDYLAHYPASKIRLALIQLFKVLDTPLEKRDLYLDDDLKVFPYVNGGLFSNEDIEIPQFTEDIKKLILTKASEDFDWSEISPTIFGAVFESTLNPVTRRTGGMHYTSIENIHKVIDPLFMDDLNDEFSKCKTKKQLVDFQNKLSNLKFLDPACGSGNFLTESYVSLRRLENKIIQKLQGGQTVLGDISNPIKVDIHQFYGIEINDYAVSVAKTALWIAEIQMMHETADIMQIDFDYLPLKSYHNIKEGNALRLDWTKWEIQRDFTTIYAEKVNWYIQEENHNGMMLREQQAAYGEVDLHTKSVNVVRKVENKTYNVDFDYIMGNPPFVGASFCNENQKNDIVGLYGKIKLSNSLDYVSGWYYKASNVIQNTNIKVAFVSTNSITQGEQVFPIWNTLMERFNIHIDFAYSTFRWDSESLLKAHVHCVVIGFSCTNGEKPRKLYKADGICSLCRNISPYLIDAPSIVVKSCSKPISASQSMIYGNKPSDGGNLILSEEEKYLVLQEEPNLSKYIKEYIGSDEYINRKVRYCLWLDGISPLEIKNSKILYGRVQNVRKMRLESTSSATRQKAELPHLFFFISQPKTPYLLIPRVSSENRRYIPIGFLPENVIASDACSIVPNASLYHFGLLISNIHMAWMRLVAGRLKSDYRYSGSVVYNTFPWPSPTENQRIRIEKTAQAILDAREKHPECSLAILYDEVTMPVDLRHAHQDNDRAVMAAYGFDTKMTENECVAKLLEMYRELTNIDRL